MDKMISIRDILAENLKKSRKKCGLSQAKLAEKANITTQYIAMIEVSRKFPTPEMLERLANALGIQTYELFVVASPANKELEHLKMDIIKEVNTIKESLTKDIISEVAKTIKETLSDEWKRKRK